MNDIQCQLWGPTQGTCLIWCTALWEPGSTALWWCGRLATAKEMVPSLFAVCHVSPEAWPVCQVASLSTCVGTQACGLILDCCPGASFHFPSNTLPASLLRHWTLICLETAWLLFSQANNHFLESSQLSHQFAAWFFSFHYISSRTCLCAQPPGLRAATGTGQVHPLQPPCCLRPQLFMHACVLWALR